jgi:hypothetical protein
VYLDTHELTREGRPVRGIWGSYTSLFQQNKILPGTTDRVFFCFQKTAETETKPKDVKHKDNEPNNDKLNVKDNTDNKPTDTTDGKPEDKTDDKNNSIKFSILASFIVLAFNL